MTATLLTLTDGEDILPALSTNLPTQGWVQGTGHVEAVEVRVAGESSDPIRALRGRFTLLSLLGPAGGPFTVILARTTDAGLEVLGGTLVRARSAGVNLLITTVRSAADDVNERASSSRRSVTIPPPRPVEPATPAAARSVVPPAPTTGTTSWNAVVAVSEDAPLVADTPETSDDEDDLMPASGDHVDHFSFGLCEVITSDGERLRIRDLKGPGRVREISLAMLTVQRPTGSAGKRHFRLLRKT